MRFATLLVMLFFSVKAAAQDFVDPGALPLVPYRPAIYGVDSENRIGISFIFENGLKIVLPDKRFKVIQFDVVYDCHSRCLFDFDVKRYKGDKVDGKDVYLRKRVLAGDVMDIVNTVIEKDGLRYKMKGVSFIVTN